MKTVQAFVLVVALALAVLVVSYVGCSNIDECQREGHSYNYCYQLLYGRR